MFCVNRRLKEIFRVWGNGQNGKKVFPGTQKIPRIIHQTWKDKKIPGEIYKKHWRESWRLKNPDWDYRFWTDRDNRNLIKKHYRWFLEIYDKYPQDIQRADAARYFILFHYGGMYVDLDFECLKPFDPLLDRGDVILGSLFEKEGSHPENIPNALMLARQGSDFMQKVIELLPEKKDAKAVEYATGPAILAEAVKTYRGHDKLFICEKGAFYPINWATDEGWELRKRAHAGFFMENDPHRFFPESFAVTYWMHNW